MVTSEQQDFDLQEKLKENPSLKVAEKKRFDFRERRRHEPPELNYRAYEFYDEVQKEIK